jgi:hypothetical protein
VFLHNNKIENWITMFQRTQKKAAQLLDEKGLRHKFIELLARREYSYGELEQKLLPQA